MPKTTILKATGTKDKEISLNPAVFGVKVKPQLLQQVIVCKLANNRQAIAHTKVFGECRGGGRKPWRQKGTGRARHGSIRSPLWRGGAVTFGPRSNRTFGQKVNRKVKRQALLMALSYNQQEKRLLIVSDLPVKEGRTKELFTVLQKMKAEAGALFVVEKMNSKLRQAVANLPKATVVPANSLDAEVLLRYPKVIVTASALKEIEKILKIKD